MGASGYRRLLAESDRWPPTCFRADTESAPPPYDIRRRPGPSPGAPLPVRCASHAAFAATPAAAVRQALTVANRRPSTWLRKRSSAMSATCQAAVWNRVAAA